MSLDQYRKPPNEFNTAETWEIPFYHSNTDVHSRVLAGLAELLGQPPVLSDHPEGAYVCWCDQDTFLAFLSVIKRPVPNFAVQIMKADRYQPLAQAIHQWATSWCDGVRVGELL